MPHQLTAAVKEAYKANEASVSRIVLEQGTTYLYKYCLFGECKILRF